MKSASDVMNAVVACSGTLIQQILARLVRQLQHVLVRLAVCRVAEMAGAGRSDQLASVLPLVAIHPMNRIARKGPSSERNCGVKTVGVS